MSYLAGLRSNVRKVFFEDGLTPPELEVRKGLEVQTDWQEEDWDKQPDTS